MVAGSKGDYGFYVIIFVFQKTVRKIGCFFCVEEFRDNSLLLFFDTFKIKNIGRTTPKVAASHFIPDYIDKIYRIPFFDIRIFRL